MESQIQHSLFSTLLKLNIVAIFNHSLLCSVKGSQTILLVYYLFMPHLLIYFPNEFLLTVINVSVFRRPWVFPPSNCPKTVLMTLTYTLVLKPVSLGIKLGSSMSRLLALQ